MARIRHLVLVGWQPAAPVDVSDQAGTLARGLATTIPGILAVEEGRSVSPEGLEGPYEWALSILFEDEEARDGYLPHPDHRVLADLIGRYQAALAVVDIAV